MSLFNFLFKNCESNSHFVTKILASFLKPGQNPQMTSEKNGFFRTPCEDFVLASKMKPKFEFLTPPYFCDIGIFDKVVATVPFLHFSQNY